MPIRSRWERALLVTVDGDPAVAGLLRRLLDAAGLLTLEARAFAQAAVALDERLPDCVILHTGASGREALLLVERVRSTTTVPVIIISDRVASDDQVAELVEAGADDFITVPFGQRELIARVSRAIRRWRNGGGVQQRVELGSVVLDTMKLSLSKDGRSVWLSPLQFKLLLALAEQPGAVLPRSALIAAGWGSPYHASDDALRVTIKRLRKRLALIGGDSGPTVVAVPGFGYYLAVDGHDV